MVGLIQILVAVLKLGDLTRYISESVILGFMTGAGFLIALTQVGNLLGLEDRGTGYQHILVRLWLTVTSGGSINPRSVVVSLTTVILVLGLRRLSRKYRLPRLDMLMALIVVAVLAATLGWSHPGVDGKPAVAVVGDIPAGLPAPHVPEFKCALGAENGHQCLGHRLPRLVGGAGHLQVDRQPDARAAGL